MAQKEIFVDLSMNQNKLIRAAVYSVAALPATPVLGELFVASAAFAVAGVNYLAGNHYSFVGIGNPNADVNGWTIMTQYISNPVYLAGVVNIAAAGGSGAIPSPLPPAGGQYLITGNDGTFAGLAVEAGDYVIYDGTNWQVIDGKDNSKSFVQTITTVANTPFVVTHNLGTLDVDVTTLLDSTKENTTALIVRNTANTVQITTNQARTLRIIVTRVSIV